MLIENDPEENAVLPRRSSLARAFRQSTNSVSFSIQNSRNEIISLFETHALTYIHHKVFTAVSSPYVLKYQNTSVYIQYSASRGLPRWFSGKESTGQRRRLRFHPWVGKIPWRRKWQPTPVLLPGKCHGQRSLMGYSPRGGKTDGYNWATKQQQQLCKS